MKKRMAIVFLIFALAVNGWFIYRARSAHRAKAGKRDTAARASAVFEAAQKEAIAGRKESARMLMSAWAATTSVPLLSDDLPEAVRAISWDGFPLVNQPTGLLNKRDLNPAQRDDLDTALAGFLRAYAESDPKRVIEYMRERGLELDARLRPNYEAALKRKGASDFESLSNEDLYAQFWNVNGYRTGWHALKMEPSARQVWNGHGLPLDAVFSLAGVTGTVTPVSDLFKEISSVMTFERHFRSREGSIENDSQQPQMLLCDARLILEYDETLSHATAAYLVRFWFNQTAMKWQPIALVAFGSGGERPFIPLFPF
jgi:hypothetical protein